MAEDTPEQAAPQAPLQHGPEAVFQAVEAAIMKVSKSISPSQERTLVTLFLRGDGLGFFSIDLSLA